MFQILCVLYLEEHLSILLTVHDIFLFQETLLDNLTELFYILSYKQFYSLLILLASVSNSSDLIINIGFLLSSYVCLRALP